MKRTYDVNHRCQGSVNARVSIRRNVRSVGYGHYAGWSLWCRDHDPDWDCYHDRLVALIDFCPFCGKKLEVNG